LDGRFSSLPRRRHLAGHRWHCDYEHHAGDGYRAHQRDWHSQKPGSDAARHPGAIFGRVGDALADGRHCRFTAGHRGDDRGRPVCADSSSDPGLGAGYRDSGLDADGPLLWHISSKPRGKARSDCGFARRLTSMHIQEIGENVLMAFDTLRTHKVRSALTMLGVIGGTMTVIAISSFLTGLR